MFKPSSLVFALVYILFTPLTLSQEITMNMNPVERWEAIGLPSELERIELLKAGYQTEDTEWMESHEALEDEARRENERQG